MKLYEITEAYRKLQNCEDIPEDARRDTLESLGGDLEEKADNIACIIKENNSMSNAIKKEAKEMLARASARDKNSAWLTEYLQEALKSVDKSKIETVRNKISIKQNPASVKIDDGFILWAQTNERDDLLKFTEPAPDKNSIKDYLKSGNELPLARLIRTERLEIK